MMQNAQDADSQYQKRKEEALKLQRQKEEQLARELAEKAEKDKQRAKEEAEVSCNEPWTC